MFLALSPPYVKIGNIEISKALNYQRITFPLMPFLVQLFSSLNRDPFFKIDDDFIFLLELFMSRYLKCESGFKYDFNK